MTSHQIMRERLLKNSGVTNTNRMPTLADLRKSEWNEEFETLMRNRLVMGAFRYGLMRGFREHRYDYVSDAMRRLREYRHTGNTELLVDVANEMMMLWIFDDHPNRHFAAVDGGQHAKA